MLSYKLYPFLYFDPVWVYCYLYLSQQPKKKKVQQILKFKIQAIMKNDETNTEKQAFPGLGSIFWAKKPKSMFPHDLFLCIVNILSK